MKCCLFLKSCFDSVFSKDNPSSFEEINLNKSCVVDSCLSGCCIVMSEKSAAEQRPLTLNLPPIIDAVSPPMAIGSEIRDSDNFEAPKYRIKPTRLFQGKGSYFFKLSFIKK
jgi:hypothetical protein